MPKMYGVPFFRVGTNKKKGLSASCLEVGCLEPFKVKGFPHFGKV